MAVDGTKGPAPLPMRSPGPRDVAITDHEAVAKLKQGGLAMAPAEPARHPGLAAERRPDTGGHVGTLAAGGLALAKPPVGG